MSNVDQTKSKHLISNDIFAVAVDHNLCDTLPILMIPKWYKDGVFKLSHRGGEHIVPASFKALAGVEWFKAGVAMLEEDKHESILETNKIHVFINPKTRHINYIEIIESA